jgi:alpha-tubulin suppressor-like RCC1 family protein
LRTKTAVLTALLLVALLGAGTAGAEARSGGAEAPLGSSGPPAEVAPAAGNEGTLGGISQVVAGYYNGCALLANRQVRCWGYGSYGANGDGTNDDGNTAVVVRNTLDSGPLVGAVQVAVGAYHACALLTNHQVRCWGYNDTGALGDGTTDDSNLPVPVRNGSDSANLTGVVGISAAGYSTCALLSNGQVRCWGENDYGQLGNNDTSGDDKPLPQAVRSISGPGNLTNITQIDVGYDSACARTAGGQARCWGYGGYGALGNGHEDDHSRPVIVKSVSGPGALTGVTQISIGDYNGCARLNNGQARCWGYAEEGANGTGGNSSNPDRLRPAVVRASVGAGPLTNVVSVGVGEYHMCALLSTGGGSVRCTGDNLYGMLGNGTTGVPDVYRVKTVLNGNGVPSLTGVTQMDVGSYSTCVRLSNGQARCWGYNEYGSLGDGTYDDQPLPRKVIT